MRALWVAALIAVAGCGDDNTTAEDLAATQPNDLAVPDLATAASAARGEELVKHLLFCGNCHTTPDSNGQPSTAPADFLAGGKSFTVSGGPDGGTVTVYAPNLTPDSATGTGTWTASQIQDAITVGVDKDGVPLWPTMPYSRFGNLTPDDAMSIVLYLQTLPPRSHTVPEDSAHPVMGDARLDYTPIPHTTLAASDPNYASAERGRYLANLGCLSCHSPKGPAPLGITVAQAYAGGRSIADGPIQIQSANLTPDATGLGAWSTTDIVQTLKTDLEKGAGRKLCAPMAGGPDGFGGLFDADLNDLAQFLHTLPPVANGPFSCPDGGL